MNKNETIDYDAMKKEALKNLNDGNVDIALKAAEYYIYEAVTWPDFTKEREYIMLQAQRYTGIKKHLLILMMKYQLN